MAARSICCVKQLAESPNLSSIPSNYVYHSDAAEISAAKFEASIPIIDLSLLASQNPHLKLKAVHDLDQACQQWGFFILVNHGVPEELIRGVIEAASEFFDLPEAEKPEFQPENVLSRIRYGTSFNAATDNVFCWRDFVKVFVHPHFTCPDKPQSLRKLLPEYCERGRDVVTKLSKAISESLGLEETEMATVLELSSSLQIFVANYYPRCPNPKAAMGILPHSDHGLFTLLVQNDVGGLQIQHDGRWLSVSAPANSILVNTGDHLEIFSNGKYKSVLHRAVVNDQTTRISVATANGPSLNAVVSPARQLVEAEGGAAAYAAMKYEDYLLEQQSSQLDGKTMLKRVRIHQ
ncbi:2-oxoglutarate-dependent dioxygenase 19-like [Salvia miltiorrhiza]|uniref:2-oxoglutarate-dependent dioxygenase 19-like n=1 Tax=Salvia miltiorrhiza TaxID=226208 RepID=UPI0025ACBFF4|nr:2-oxoglutarate-dependent dioxygenase 19-like [Salvia miltiorrhiza]